ncbi:MAG: CsbD family protein [Saprospiraceae bacterium]|nr:CsbD family protein [Saprospiraceae bacterium]
MNKTEIKGNWNEQKGRLKQKFAVLTDNDLMYEEGQRDEMLGKLQITLGKTKEELAKILDSND